MKRFIEAAAALWHAPPSVISELNADRVFVALLREVCAERGVRLIPFSDAWLLCLEHGGRRSYTLGYDFGLSSATAKMIAKDKSATSDVLGFHGLPRIEHRIFHSPQIAPYVGSAGNWAAMLAFFEEHGRDLVCKPNEGTGGLGVTRVRTALALEAAVTRLFQRERALCLAPFEPITVEYRVALLRGCVEFLYRKERPALHGDGRSTRRALLCDWLKTGRDFAASARQLAEAAAELDAPDSVPAAGEAFIVNWRHNLGQGAVPQPLAVDAPENQAVCALAVRAAAAVGIELASIDVVESAGELKVLEINSGIMMESLARSSVQGRAVARRFYDRIVCALFDLDPEVA